MRENQTRKVDYRSSRWTRESKRFLVEHPLCECPECLAEPEYMRDVATEVDHIDGLGLHGPRGWDPDNWQALSKRHHSRKTAARDGGFGNKKRRPPDNAPAPF